MWEADERRFLQEVRDAIERASGKPPRGWMAPWMASTHHTPDVLKEVGFDFLMDWPADDQPLWMKTRSGPIMSVIEMPGRSMGRSAAKRAWGRAAAAPASR